MNRESKQSRRGKGGEPMDRELRGEKNKCNDDLGNKILRYYQPKKRSATKLKLERGVGSWSGCV